MPQTKVDRAAPSRSRKTALRRFVRATNGSPFTAGMAVEKIGLCGSPSETRAQNAVSTMLGTMANEGDLVERVGRGVYRYQVPPRAARVFDSDVVPLFPERSSLRDGLAAKRDELLQEVEVERGKMQDFERAAATARARVHELTSQSETLSAAVALLDAEDR